MGHRMTEWYFTEFTLGSTDVEVFSRIEKKVRSKGTRTCQATEELEFLMFFVLRLLRWCEGQRNMHDTH